jgi:hypothetical protein
MSMAVSASILLALAAGPLAAQKPLQPTEPDTLGLPADTVRLPVERLEGMDGCSIPGHAVVKGRADLRRLRRFPQCAKVTPPLDDHAVVGLSIRADCQGSHRVDAFRSARRREFRVRLRIHWGGCRGLRPRYEWFSLPALPRGWTLRVMEADDPEPSPLDIRARTPVDSTRH